MRRIMKKLLPETVAALLLFMVSCATPQPIPKTGKHIIDVGNYSIEAPMGEGWNIETDEQKGVVTFSKIKQSALGKSLGAIEGTTLIRVFKNEVTQQGWHLNEEETANDFRNLEEKTMIEEGVKKGEYTLDDVKKGTTTINGKTFYFLSYKTTAGTLFGGVSPKGPLRAVEAVLYLYFPEQFREKHVFYGFLISEAYMRPSVFNVDLEQVLPVIRSFEETDVTPLKPLDKVEVVPETPVLIPGTKFIYRKRSPITGSIRTWTWVVQEKSEYNNEPAYWILVTESESDEVSFLILDMNLNFLASLKQDRTVANKAVPKIVELSWPLRVGEKWKTNFNLCVSGSGNAFRCQNLSESTSVEAYQEIKVPAGVFKAFRISSERGIRGDEIRYYAPSLGYIVKWELKWEKSAVELVEYSIPGK